jgi:hypothetical protein
MKKIVFTIALAIAAAAAFSAVTGGNFPVEKANAACETYPHC